MIKHQTLSFTNIIEVQKASSYLSEELYTPEIIDALESNAEVVAAFVQCLRPTEDVYIIPTYLYFSPVYADHYLYGLEIRSSDYQVFFFTFWNMKTKTVHVSSTKTGRDRLHHLIQYPY